MAKNAQPSTPDWLLILLLTAGYLIPQLGLQFRPQLGWLALLLPPLGALCLYLAMKRNPPPVYQRLLPWGFILAAGVLAALLFFP
ncbi:hypothetical protein ACFQ3L_04405 [Lacticaseibacillus jixianensis]|uniref:Uncharacterized protein n=1 Tax=Lacticaseibacillus jixianensis TaxID=2486012 RepID=A0ABW4B7Y8_9LACO|nr:hypothetical protein [Lacticaseibacillus jixianensis]